MVVWKDLLVSPVEVTSLTTMTQHVGEIRASKHDGGHVGVSRGRRIGDDREECSTRVWPLPWSPQVAAELLTVAFCQPERTRGRRQHSVHVEAGLRDSGGDAVQRCGCGGVAVPSLGKKQCRWCTNFPTPSPSMPACSSRYESSAGVRLQSSLRRSWRGRSNISACATQVDAAAQSSGKDKVADAWSHLPIQQTGRDGGTPQCSWQLLVAGKQGLGACRPGVTLLPSLITGWHPETEATG